jgi:uncharacterized protein YqfB (UPF0267 family)
MRIHIKKDFPPWQIAQQAELRKLNDSQSILTITKHDFSPDFERGDVVEVQFVEAEQDNFFCRIDSVHSASSYEELTVSVQHDHQY